MSAPSIVARGSVVSIVIPPPEKKRQNALEVLVVNDYLPIQEHKSISLVNKKLRILTWLSGFVLHCKRLFDTKTHRDCADLLDDICPALQNTFQDREYIMETEAVEGFLQAELYLANLPENQRSRFANFRYRDLFTGQIKRIGQIIECFASSGICATWKTNRDYVEAKTRSLNPTRVGEIFDRLMQAGGRYEAVEYIDFFDRFLINRVTGLINRLNPVRISLQKQDIQLAFELANAPRERSYRDNLKLAVINTCFHHGPSDPTSENPVENFATARLRFHYRNPTLYRYDQIFAGANVDHLIELAASIENRSARRLALVWCVGHLLHKGDYSTISRLLESDCAPPTPTYTSRSLAFLNLVVPTLAHVSLIESRDWRLWYKILEFIETIDSSHTKDWCYFYCVVNLPKNVTTFGDYALIWEKALSCLNKMSDTSLKRRGLLELYCKYMRYPMPDLKQQKLFWEGRLQSFCEEILYRLGLQIEVCYFFASSNPMPIKSLRSEYSILRNSLESRVSTGEDSHKKRKF